MSVVNGIQGTQRGKVRYMCGMLSESGNEKVRYDTEIILGKGSGMVRSTSEQRYVENCYVA